MKKKRDVRLYIDDIAEGIVRIQEYTHSITHEEFLANNMVHDAIFRRLRLSVRQPSTCRPISVRSIVRSHGEKLPECATNSSTTISGSIWS